MSFATLERAVLAGAKVAFKNPKLRLKDLMEWSSHAIRERKGEVVVWIKDPGVNVAIKKELDKRGEAMDSGNYDRRGTPAYEQIGWLEREVERLKDAIAKQSHDIEQTLGKALGYPRYVDDQKNFPDATEADGVCVGEHVPESLALEAANKIKRLQELYDSACNIAAQRADELRVLRERECGYLSELRDYAKTVERLRKERK